MEVTTTTTTTTPHPTPGLSLNQKKSSKGVCIHFWQQIIETRDRNTQGSRSAPYVLDNIGKVEACLIADVTAIKRHFYAFI